MKTFYAETHFISFRTYSGKPASLKCLTGWGTFFPLNVISFADLNSSISLGDLNQGNPKYIIKPNNIKII